MSACLPRAMSVTLAVCAGAAAADWKLMHDMDFSSNSALDPVLWAHETGHLRNQESQYYTQANVTVQQGALVIEARRETVANAQWRAGSRDWRSKSPTARYTSGSVVFRPLLHFGRIEVVARSPSGRGMWPALWLLHEAAGEYGEIDIFEAVGKHADSVFAAVHFGRTAKTRKHVGGSIVLPGFEKNWRLHTLEWTPQRIEMRVDEKPVFRFDPGAAEAGGINPLLRPMQLHINLALGGNWGGKIDDTALPARFEIRSLRIYRWDGNEGSAAAIAPRPEINAAQQDPAPEAAPMRWGR